MLRNILRSAILLLSGLLLAATVLPDAAQARGGFYARSYGYGLHRPAYRPFAAVGLGVGLGYGYYRYPLDESLRLPLRVWRVRRVWSVGVWRICKRRLFPDAETRADRLWSALANGQGVQLKKSRPG